ncbi:MAG: DUF4013 domain-containing protein [Syntrophomonadaceae bacterium]|nr:DUF4013 domain-containing protein [Syntrophomonadaceae bacterium]
MALDIVRSFKFPFQDPDWVTKLVVGGLLGLLPVLNLLAVGYVLEVMRAGTEGREEMPPWEAWADKFVLGLVSFLIGFLYLLVPVAVMVAGGAGAALGWPGMPLFAGGTMLAVLLMLAVAFLLPMALAHYAATNRLAAAFALGEIAARIAAVAADYLAAFVLSLTASVLTGLLVAVPLLGPPVAVFAGFYFSVVFASAFGMLYQRGEAGAAG